MKGDINPAQAQRKKEKERQLKKQKQERQNQRNERLAKRNPSRQLKQIDELESRINTLTSSEKAHLESLKKDVEEIERARKQMGMTEIERKKKSTRVVSNNDSNNKKKSYYWDPIINPEGDPPEGEEQAWMPDEEDSGYSTSESVSEIPLPERKPPSVEELKAGPAKSTYESAPVIKDLYQETTQMVPAAVKRKKAENSYEQTPMEKEYASEEEEYHQHDAKRRAVQLESVPDNEDL